MLLTTSDGIEINTFVAAHLVTLEASALVAWREALRPAKAQLIKPLASDLSGQQSRKNRLAPTPRRRWQIMPPTGRTNCSTCWLTPSNFSFPWCSKAG